MCLISFFSPGYSHLRFCFGLSAPTSGMRKNSKKIAKPIVCLQQCLSRKQTVGKNFYQKNTLDNIKNSPPIPGRLLPHLVGPERVRVLLRRHGGSGPPKGWSNIQRNLFANVQMYFFLQKITQDVNVVKKYHGNQGRNNKINIYIYQFKRCFFPLRRRTNSGSSAPQEGSGGFHSTGWLKKIFFLFNLSRKNTRI